MSMSERKKKRIERERERDFGLVYCASRCMGFGLVWFVFLRPLIGLQGKAFDGLDEFR